ncbi:MAG: FixH family protein [Phycisphaeraceae bacterium]|nr:FixH family protein [Phycisphaeraceae bacterium]
MKSASKRLWPGMIFALLGLNVCVVAFTVVASRAHSSSFSVERDYDRKALHWEETARQRERNSELGWVLELERAGGGAMAVRLRDRDGRAVEGARVEFEAFHHARARERIAGELRGSPEGVYIGEARIDRAGLWEFRFIVRRGDQVFTQDMTRAMVEGVS